MMSHVPAMRVYTCMCVRVLREAMNELVDNFLRALPGLGQGRMMQRQRYSCTLYIHQTEPFIFIYLKVTTISSSKKQLELSFLLSTVPSSFAAFFL